MLLGEGDRGARVAMLDDAFTPPQASGPHGDVTAIMVAACHMACSNGVVCQAVCHATCLRLA